VDEDNDMLRHNEHKVYLTLTGKRNCYFFIRSHIDATWSIVSCTFSSMSCIDCRRSRNPWDFSFCISNTNQSRIE